MTFDDLQNNNLPSENLVEDLKIDLDLIKLTLLITKNIIILGIGALLPLVIGKSVVLPMFALALFLLHCGPCNAL